MSKQAYANLSVWVSCFRLIFINFVLFHSPIKEKASNDPKNKKAATGGKQDGAAGKKADAKPTANRKPSQKKKSQLDDKQEYAALRDAIDGECCHGSVIHCMDDFVQQDYWKECFCFLTCKANNKKTIKEIVCRNLEKKEDAKKLVEDYNSRYSKVNHFGVNFVNSYSYNVKCVYEAQDAQVKCTEQNLRFAL